MSWPTISLTQIISGVSQPTAIVHAGDNSGRIFILERAGRIRIIKNNTLQTTPFLDITSRVTSSGDEQGLLGIAFPPGYSSKRYFYVNYTNKTGIGNTVIARYRISSDLDIADSTSEEIILTITQPETNHNGGQLQFGPDGYLYVGTGDGGGGGDNHGTIGNAQNPSSLLGKILRINVEQGNGLSPQTGATVSSPANSQIYLPLVSKGYFTYTIPATNPYTQTAGYRGEIWALGLRNPWRFSFDRQTNDLYVADVGQDAWEEIDYQPASSRGGENYGWRCYEGSHTYNTSGCLPVSNYVAPIAEYPHGVNDSNGCSISGGYVYRGPGNAAMQGIYFYGDFCTGRIWGLQNVSGIWQNQQLAQFSIGISTFGEDQLGNLYVADYNSGKIYQITSP